MYKRQKLGGEGGGSVSNDEINALRREMLEAELERERLANELEQEREERDKAQREASAKIDNLTKLVLRTDADAEEEKKTTGKVLKDRRAPRERGRMGSSLTSFDSRSIICSL